MSKWKLRQIVEDYLLIPMVLVLQIVTMLVHYFIREGY